MKFTALIEVTSEETIIRASKVAVLQTGGNPLNHASLMSFALGLEYEQSPTKDVVEFWKQYTEPLKRLIG
jgi:hypothetical protein